MSITKYCYHKDNLSELSKRFSSFSELEDAKVREIASHLWQEKGSGETSHDFMVAFFGKTGYGKSSTVNAFFGRDIMATSDVEACTRVCNCLDYEISPGHYLSLGDFPGIGESEYRDAEYLGLYRDFMHHVGVVVYVMRADARDHSIDEKAYHTLFTNHDSRKKVIIALNQCDKVEPVSRRLQKEPTTEQMDNIQKKIDFLQSKFQPKTKIIPYSATTGWNMDRLASEMVNSAIKSKNIIVNTDSIEVRLKSIQEELASLKSFSFW